MTTIYKVSAEGSKMYSLFLTLEEAQANATARAAKTGRVFTVETVTAQGGAA
jgi:hypothetical protein